MTTPTSELNRIAVDLDEAELWTLATIVREYADILRQTTEGTDALAKRQEAEERHLLDRTGQVWQLDHTEQIWGLCRTYEQRLKVVEAENARLKAAMDKYSEDETLGGFRGELLLRRCIEICQEEAKDDGTAQKIEARIRELKRGVRAVSKVTFKRSE